MLNINGRQLEMEVDTGAAVSLISRSAYDSLWNGPDEPLLKSSPYRLTTYTGEIIQPCGTCDVSVDYDDRHFQLPLLVVPGEGPSLLGRNWLQVVQLNWRRIHQLRAVNANPAVEEILAK